MNSGLFAHLARLGLEGVQEHHALLGKALGTILQGVGATPLKPQYDGPSMQVRRLDPWMDGRKNSRKTPRKTQSVSLF